MRTKHDIAEINHLLGGHGLATLDDPQGLVQQLSFLVQDDAQLRRLLNKCEPEHRRAMYESLRPNLSFEPKPLDVYISESAADAEARRLPTIGADGMLKEFKIPGIHSTVQEIVEEASAREFLTLTCRKCTKTTTYSGVRKVDAVSKARDAGWAYDQVGERQYAICPDCPAIRN